MDELSVVKHTLVWSALLTVIGGLITTFTLLEPPPAQTEKFVRTPANQVEPAPLLQEFEVRCGTRKGEAFAGFAAQIRINGEHCPQTKTVSVVNQTNGFSATIFPVPETRFTTDYISLNSGENHIEITEKSESGETRVQEVVLTR